MSSKATGAQPNGNAEKNRQHHDGSSGRAFTVEQKAAVIRIRRCKTTAFYDILGLEEVRTTCTDGEIKKAYRKLSLLTHPDKNGYEGADEAFKMVSRAFQTLSDPDKKSRYDKFGGDPDSRFSAAGASGASPFSNFAQQRGGYGGRRGPMFEEEISPEELFRQFFGGGGMGMGMGGPFGGGPFGGFGGGPGFVFNMGGGPGIRVHQFGGNTPRRRPHNHEGAEQQPERSMFEMIRSLLPLFLLFVFPLLSNLFSGPSTPSVRLDRADSRHTLYHQSPTLKVHYYVQPADVEGYSSRQWGRLDQVAESQYLTNLGAACDLEQSRQQRMVQAAHGFFYTDQEKLQEARTMPQPNCERIVELRKKGLIRY